MLKVEDVNQHYGGSHILRGVSFEAAPGKVTAVLGRNGVGKTTLLKAIMGLLPVSSGRITFGGADLTRAPPHQRVRSGIGYVPQGREIFPGLTVHENLKMGLASRPAGTPIPERVFELFPILKTLLRRRGGDLSGGQQQQLAIGRALVTRPKLLVLDEPTEGIQPSIIKDIGRAIGYLRNLKEMAIVLVEQYLDFAQELGDHLVVMDRGSIVYSCDRASMDEAALKRALAI